MSTTTVWLVLLLVFLPWRRLRMAWHFKRDHGLAYTWRRAWRAAGRGRALS